MKFVFLYSFSGLLSSEACSLCGLIASLTSSPFAEIAMRHTRKRQIGYVPVPPSAQRSLSSVGLDWEAWPMRWITKQSLSMRTSLISHGAQVSTTPGISNPSISNLQEPCRERTQVNVPHLALVSVPQW